MEGQEKAVETKDTDTLQRKHPFDNLSKEELVKKCKHFLMLAQKAKQAKDDANEEIQRLKEELAKYEGTTEMKSKEAPKHTDATSMQEMIDTLTEQKLSLVIEMDKVLKQSASVERQLEQVKQDERKARQQVNQLTNRVQELETALESAHRQVKRLTRENDDLLQQLDTVELELRSLRDRGIERTESIKAKQRIVAVENEMAILQEELDRVNEENKKKNDQMKQLHDQFSQEKLAYEEQFKRRQISWEERICELQDQFKKEKSVFEQTLEQEKKTMEDTLKHEIISWKNKLNELKEQFLTEKQEMELNAKQQVLTLSEQFENEKLSLEEKHKQLIREMEEQKIKEMKTVEEGYIQKLQNQEETFAEEKQAYTENFKQQLLTCEKHYKQELKLREEKFAQKLKKCEEKFCEEFHIVEDKFLRERHALEEQLKRLQEKAAEEKQCLEQKYNAEIAELEKKFEQEKTTLMDKLRKEKHIFEEKLQREKNILEEKYRKEIESISEARNNVKDANLEIEKLTREIQNLFEEKEQFATHVHNLKETLKYTNAEKDAYFQVKERLKHDNESLLDQLKAIMSEKDRVVSGIENVKQNNAELNQLIQSLGAERESFLKDIAKLNMEKKKLLERLDVLEADNSAIIEDNCYLKSELQKLKELLEKITAEKILISEDNVCLKSEKQKLNDLLEKVSVEKIVISEENSCLKAEKEKLETTLESVNADRTAVLEANTGLKAEKEKVNHELLQVRAECESLHSEMANAMDMLNNAVHNHLLDKLKVERLVPDSKENEQGSADTLVQVNEPKTCATLSDIITSLCESLERISVTRNSASSANVSDYSGSKEVTESDSQENKSSISGHIQNSDASSENGTSVEGDRYRDEIQKLHSELEHLNSVISNMEAHGEELQTENDSLKEGIRLLISNVHSDFPPQYNLSETVSEVRYFNNETLDKLGDILGKEQAEKFIEIFCTVKRQAQEINNLKYEIASITEMSQQEKTDSGEKLLTDLKSCQDDIRNKVELISHIEEELSQFLGTQISFQYNSESLANLRKELSEKKNVLEQNSEEVLELQNLKATLDSKSKEYEKLRSELLFIQDVSKDKERELNLLKERLENIEEKHKSEICALQERHFECEDVLSAMKEEGFLSDGMEENSLHSKEAVMAIIRKLHNQLGERTSVIEKLVQQCETSKNELSRLHDDLKLIRQERDQFESNASHFKNLVETNNEELISLKQSFVDLKSQSESCISGLQNNLRDVQTECSMYKKLVEEQCNDTDSTKAQLMQVISQSDEVMVELKKVQDELRNTTERLMAKTKEAEEVKEITNALEKKNSALLDEMNKIQDEYNSLKMQFVAKQEEVLSLENQLNTCHKTIEDLQKDLNLSTEKCDNKSKECVALSAEISALKNSAASELNSVREMHDIAIRKMQHMERELNEADNRFKCQTEELKQKTKLLEEEKQSKEELNRNLMKIKTASKQLNCSYIELRKQSTSFQAVLREQIVVATATLHTIIDRLAQSQAVESVGILHDMNEMNQALKLRGETISKLQEAVSDLEQQLQETRKRLASTQEELQTVASSLDKKIVEVQSLETENSQQKEEIAQMRSRLTEFEKEAAVDVARSEVTSNSTISKTEEQARLKDLEDTFEERYTKLRTVAVRLKKRVAELTAHLTQLEAERNKLLTDKQELQACVTQMSAQAKHLQTLQQEYDKLQDTLEQQKAEMSKAKKNQDTALADLEKLRKHLEQCLEEKLNVEKLLESCSSEKLTLERTWKEQTNQLKNLRKEVELQNNSYREKEITVSQLQEQLNKLQQKLSEEETNHQATKEALEMSMQECKKNSLLTLEMDDYEKRLSQLTQQLEKEKARVSELESHLNTQREIEQGLHQQINLLEQRVTAEETRNKEAKEQLNIIRQRLCEAESLSKEKEAVLQDAKRYAENLREELEAQQLELAATAAEKQKIEANSHKQQTVLIEKVSVLEEQLEKLQHERDKFSTELAEVHSEFESYKIRAASVLRQKARPEETAPVAEDGAQQEIAQLRKTNDMLRGKLEEMSTEIALLEQELSSVRQERARTADQVQELLSTVSTLQQQVEQLQEKARDTALQHAEVLRNQKLHTDTLVLCYKKQIKELEERLADETTAIKQQLERTEEKLRVTHKPVIEVPEKQLKNEASSFTTVTSQNMEIALLEREECEGSENVDSMSPHLSSARDLPKEPVPLERLLESPVDVDGLPSQETEITNTGEHTSPEAALQDSQLQLRAAEARGRHLASLLSEAERELALSQQQAKLLKDELRRNQRSAEREQHAHNLEYLKNVLLKFVTLQGGDERTRLVPVLNTILKLSPEETNQLLAVSKGGVDASGSGRGWGSYLPIWPSL
ncbi:GRIP and coiled-coil domain-containing protein 2 [Schistocerca americana]|uniref:GRIP and coiled-coil domain-containing protein 2 n=1 Tax=Schistocerca americana TaxID=7009 RepID=UPI001F4FA4BF|nr:GRIP and coiled-coil domain-containing protein 2 [Schistocerca americana]